MIKRIVASAEVITAFLNHLHIVKIKKLEK